MQREKTAVLAGCCEGYRTGTFKTELKLKNKASTATISAISLIRPQPQPLNLKP